MSDSSSERRRRMIMGFLVGCAVGFTSSFFFDMHAVAVALITVACGAVFAFIGKIAGT